MPDLTDEARAQQLAEDVLDGPATEADLDTIRAAFAAAREERQAEGQAEGLRRADENYGRAVRDVFTERLRQDAKWGEQNHDPFCYLTVLVEEVGEFAQAALHARFGGHAANDMRKEAIHVAAVAFAVVELLDRGKWYWGRNDGRPVPPTWKPGEEAGAGEARCPMN